MIEWTVQVIFTTPSLGNQKTADGRFLFQKSESGQILFLPTWHKANMVFAANMLGLYQTAVPLIMWDPVIDAALREKCFTQQFYTKGDRQRFSLHETLYPGQTAGINFVAPPEIPHDGLIKLFSKAGSYRGVSPWKPGQFGHFRVNTLTQRQLVNPVFEEETE